jgi:hypothetical protein
MIRTGVLEMPLRKNISVKYGTKYVPFMNKICAHNSLTAIKETIGNKKTEKSSKYMDLLLISKCSFDVTVPFLKISPQSQTTQKRTFSPEDLTKMPGSLAVEHPACCQRKQCQSKSGKICRNFRH